MRLWKVYPDDPSDYYMGPPTVLVLAETEERAIDLGRACIISKPREEQYPREIMQAELLCEDTSREWVEKL